VRYSYNKTNEMH